MVAAIGVAVGVHAYPLAITGTVLALVVLEFYRWVERRMAPRDAAGTSTADAENGDEF